jgi:hypothetical protein
MLNIQSDVSGIMSVKWMSMMSKMSEDIKIQFKRKAKSEFFGSQKNHF